jgi:hypothetical protein
MGSYAELMTNYASVEKMGQSIAKSGMFGCQSMDQGIVIATHCFLSNLSPLEYSKRYMMVNGKPMKKYDAMLAEFRQLGGSHKVLSKTCDLASIEMEFKGEKNTFSLAWEDAKKETFPYNGKESEIISKLANGQSPDLKPKYTNPRDRSIMLWARLISDSVRTMTPEVNFGVYTPEELEDLPGDSNSTRTTPEVPTPKAPTEVKLPPTPVDVPQPKTPLVEVPQPLAGTDEPPIDPASPITDKQVERIRELVKIINQAQSDFSKRLKDKLIAAGVPDGKATGLTYQEGAQLLERLEKKEIEAALTISLTPRTGAANPT